MRHICYVRDEGVMTAMYYFYRADILDLCRGLDGVEANNVRGLCPR